jgi:ABC transporter substrate binding protein
VISQKLIGLALGAIFLALSCPAQAQQAKKAPRIGYLAASPLSAIATRTEAFRQGLRELGYVEGKDIVIEWRSAEGKFDRLPDLAAELVRLNVHVVVTGGPMDTRAAKGATSTIPIVMTWDQDPVGSGFVASLARPGGNVTGLSILAPEISGKQLELLKEIVPRLSRVAFLGNSTEPGNAQALREMETGAQAFGVRLATLPVSKTSNFDTGQDRLFIYKTSHEKTGQNLTADQYADGTISARLIRELTCNRRRIHMKTKAYSMQETSTWQRIFLQSKVNGASYRGEQLSGFNWSWPQNTYLQRRLKQLRRYRSSDFADLHQLAR